MVRDRAGAEVAGEAWRQASRDLDDAHARQRAALKAMRAAGMSLRAIEETTGLSRQTIADRLSSS